MPASVRPLRARSARISPTCRFSGRRRPAALVLTALLSLALAGCTGGETEPAGESPPSPSAAAAASASASPSAGPSPSGSPIAAPPSEEEVADIVEAYRAYVAGQVDDLIAATEDLSAAIKKGSPAEARSRYPASRRAWATVRPVADRVDGLVGKVDAPWRVPSDLAAAEKEWSRQSEAAMWAPGSKAAEGAGDGGWRRIEWSIFADKTIKHLSPVGDELLKNLEELRTKVPDLQFAPADMAADAAELVGDTAPDAADGTAERYSQADLDVLAGNLDGARKIVDLLRPVADARDPGLVATLQEGLGDVAAALEELKDEAGYVAYDDELTGRQRVAVRAAGDALDSLAEPIGQLEDAVR